MTSGSMIEKVFTELVAEEKVRTFRESPRFTEQEMQRAAEDIQGAFGLGGTSPKEFMTRIAVQIRKNRAYGG